MQQIEQHSKAGNPNWVKGTSGNPLGRDSIRQDFVTRFTYLVDKYKVHEVIELVENPKKFNQLSTFDAKVIMRIYEAIKENGGNSMDKLLDRVMGKATQPISATIQGNLQIASAQAASEAARLTPQQLMSIRNILESVVVTDAEYTELSPEPVATRTEHSELPADGSDLV